MIMRKTWLRSLQGLALVSSIAFLTGAKGQGCGGGSETGEGGNGGGIACPDHQVAQNICDGMGDDCDPSGCHNSCAPLCPPGATPAYSCPPEPFNGPDVPVCSGDDCVSPPSCGYVCQPTNVCGVGYHQEEICSGGGNPTGGGGYVNPGGPEQGTGGNVIDPGGPDQNAGGSTSSPGNPGDPDCQIQCVPDACPPGTIAETTCSGPPSGSGGGIAIPDYIECSTQCVPSDCPPGQHQQICATPVDDGTGGSSDCQPGCVPDAGGGTGGGFAQPL
jgi:hypothetical protein